MAHMDLIDSLIPTYRRLNLRVRPIIVRRATDGFPGVPAFLHFAAYYQAEKGGYLGYSFGRYFTNFVHYRPGVDIGMAEDQEWNPQLFDARREVPKYDCFIVRMERDVGDVLFARSPRNVPKSPCSTSIQARR